MNEKIKKFGKRIAAIGVGIAAVICGILIRERNDPYRKRARKIKELVDTAGDYNKSVQGGIEDLVDTAGDYNKSAQDGIEEAIRILQKARKR